MIISLLHKNLSAFAKVGIAMIIVLICASFMVDSQDTSINEEDWGFFGHRQLNRYAVFTLPPEMQYLYKRNIAYLTDHAVDPDKRRYAASHEAVRHYIDLDHFGSYPFDNLPRKYIPAVVSRSELEVVRTAGDTIRIKPDSLNPLWGNYVYAKNQEIYQDGSVSCSCDSLIAWKVDSPCQSLRIVDELTPYGIAPYNLPKIENWLTKAFMNGDKKRILQLSAEIGHYIGDAHVPLHTTTNYNGQLTNQVGIHAFWESRLPELFMEEEYNNFVGSAEYIEDTPSFYWDVVLESHLLVDSVLLIEKRLSKEIPEDQHYCYEERLGRTVRIPCRKYAESYHLALDGMVEKRWRATVHSIGNIWYTAWVNAGKPNLRKLDGNLENIVDEVEYVPSSNSQFRHHDY